MSVNPSELRANLYRLLDEVLETGIPLEVERRGRLLRIVPDDGHRSLDRLVPHPAFLVGDREDVVEMDWSSSWHPEPH